MENAKLTCPTTGWKIISNTQHAFRFTGTAMLKHLSEFIIIVLEKKILLTPVLQNLIPKSF